MWTLRPLASLSLILIPSCAPVGGYATSAVCAELRADLPSWSSHDTAQSRAEGARFVTTFSAICG